MRKALLFPGSYGEEQVLETDIMRFVAVIGMVFWILFALIKGLEPQAESKQPTTKASVVEQPAKKMDTPENPAKPRGKIKDAPAQTLMQQPPGKMTDARKQQGETKSPPSKKEIRLQFQSLDLLQELIQRGQVELFARARAKGFDLIYSGRVDQTEVRFTKANQLPRKLWQIETGQGYAFFLKELLQDSPALRSFPEKTILVAFSNETFDQQLENKLNNLRQNGKSGILNVTGRNDFEFSPDTHR